MNKQILLIGAGQLGSRHLQGLLKFEQPMAVYVLDPLQSSLDTASNRANEVPNSHDVHFLRDWTDLPNAFDLVIVATNSDVRESVINILLETHSTKFLILEKVMFQQFDSYKRVSDLLKKKGVQTWVNHPRRMFGSYHVLKSKLINDTNKVFQVTGGNWGLGCNGLHYIDLFVYLSGSKVKSIDCDWVDCELQESKRSGFIEFTGIIKGLLEDNSSFQITSLKGETTAGTITVFDIKKRFIVMETGTPQIMELSVDKAFNPEFVPFEMQFQSSLTTRLVADLFEKGSCDLPTYEQARHSHEIFISTLLKKYNQITGINHKILPIT